jgi:hypothetical protein
MNKIWKKIKKLEKGEKKLKGEKIKLKKISNKS